MIHSEQVSQSQSNEKSIAASGHYVYNDDYPFPYTLIQVPRNFPHQEALVTWEDPDLIYVLDKLVYFRSGVSREYSYNSLRDRQYPAKN